MGNNNICKPCLDTYNKVCKKKDIELTRETKSISIPKNQEEDINFKLKVNKTNIFSERSKSKEYTKCTTLLSRKLTTFELSNISELFLIDCLRKINLFNEFSNSDLLILIKSMHVIDCLANHELVNESNPLLFFFIIEYGMFIVKDGSNEVLLKESSSYGESSLLHKVKLNGVIKCISDAKLFALSKTEFTLFLKSVKQKRFNDKYDMLKTLPIISKKIILFIPNRTHERRLSSFFSK